MLKSPVYIIVLLIYLTCRINYAQSEPALVNYTDVTLSGIEISSIIDLAHRNGIEPIDKIQIGYEGDGIQDRSKIYVWEQAQITDNYKVSTRVLGLRSRFWGNTSKKDTNQFVIQEIDTSYTWRIITNSVILNLHQDSSVTFEEARNLILMIIAKNYLIKNFKIEVLLENCLSNFYRIRKRNNEYEISFCYTHYSRWFNCRIENGKLYIFNGGMVM